MHRIDQIENGDSLTADFTKVHDYKGQENTAGLLLGLWSFSFHCGLTLGEFLITNLTTDVDAMIRYAS